ncbi:MAG: radical SAM protein, partial [Xanthomonadales bacterium]|nr:radical SAM protein [Xanthomonadales bacterium]
MDLISARTAPMPRVLWIELSSRCPFDCIFCTRASLRGAGELLDLALYRRLIGELERPQIIRLNYAGESGHYPQLAEAVALAAATGADVELVSALASLKPGRLQAALDAGLTRLTVSLHTLDAGEFDAIYRFSSLAAMHQRLQQVLDWRRNSDRRFLLDLA